MNGPRKNSTAVAAVANPADRAITATCPYGAADARPLVIGRGRAGLELPAQTRLEDCVRLAPRYFAMGEDVLVDCDLRAAEGGAGAYRIARVG